MKRINLIILAFIITSLSVNAQEYTFKELKQTEIKGAAKLSQPTFVKAGNKYISAAKFGQAAPSLYDWDGDGKLDMLVGEFGGGNKANILVFKNVGTKVNPIYSSQSFYAKDSDGKYLFISGS